MSLINDALFEDYLVLEPLLNWITQKNCRLVELAHFFSSIWQVQGETQFQHHTYKPSNYVKHFKIIQIHFLLVTYSVNSLRIGYKKLIAYVQFFCFVLDNWPIKLFYLLYFEYKFICWFTVSRTITFRKNLTNKT